MANFLDKMTQEASSLQLIDQALGMLQDGASVEHLPVAPLYSALKRQDPASVAKYLPQLSQEQRQTFLDLDLWSKDNVTPPQMDFWMLAYGALSDEDLIYEFVTSDQFLLYLKSRLNIWTFDVEDPQYPDHDYYFVSDDQQILFEYDEDFAFVEELKRFLNVLYSRQGVEGAYTFLFKVINESFLSLQEDEYQDKKERLRDLGFVDYFEALELLSPLAKVESIEGYLKKRRGATGVVFTEHQTQNLMGEVVVDAKEEFDFSDNALVVPENEERLSFIRFNFIRLVNAAIILEGGHGASSLARKRTLKKASFLVNLGAAYAQDLFGDVERAILHEWDFFDLYKAGATLCRAPLSTLKKVLSEVESHTKKEEFLGDELNGIINQLFSLPPRFPESGEFCAVEDLKSYQKWREWCLVAGELALLAQKFHAAYAQVQKKGEISFLNYDNKEIHFELLLISSLVKQLSEGEAESKTGLAKDDFMHFLEEYYGFEKETFRESLYERLEALPSLVENKSLFDSYLRMLFSEYLEGLDYRSLGPEEWKHVGGVIIKG